VFVQIDDASTAQNVYVPIGPGLAGQLIQVRTVLGAAISGADDKVIVRKNGTDIGTITVANTSSATGDQDYLDFTNSQIFVTESDRLTIRNGGESTDAAPLGVTITIKR
jgi:glutamyl/glutaminyl-tRNA synthetase